MAGINVKLSGFEQLKKRLNEGIIKMPKAIDAELRASAMKMREGALKDAPGDTGRLRGTIQVAKQSELNHGVFAQSAYAAFIEFGTKGRYKPIPGYEDVAAEAKGIKGGTWQEFLRNITAWVKRKGLAGTYSTGIRKKKGGGFEQGGSKGKRRKNSMNALEDIEVAYVIARSIWRKGIKPHPFFFKQLEAERPNLLRNIENVLKAI
jgi:hypothetical protein